MIIVYSRQKNTHVKCWKKVSAVIHSSVFYQQNRMEGEWEKKAFRSESLERISTGWAKTIRTLFVKWRSDLPFWARLRHYYSLMKERDWDSFLVSMFVCALHFRLPHAYMKVPTADPVVSRSTSQALGPRFGTKAWCTSSLTAYKQQIIMVIHTCFLSIFSDLESACATKSPSIK